jgi:hypothetical protein
VAPEWVVSKASSESAALRSAIRAVISLVAQELRVGIDEIVITLYGRSFPSERGPGRFEYDILYHWSLKDPTHMFGPIIPGDARIKISESRAWWNISLGRSGGFYERENLRSAAWFKLGSNAWQTTTPPQEDPSLSPDEIKGLLFINTRRAI